MEIKESSYSKPKGVKKLNSFYTYTNRLSEIIRKNANNLTDQVFVMLIYLSECLPG